MVRLAPGLLCVFQPGQPCSSAVDPDQRIAAAAWPAFSQTHPINPADEHRLILMGMRTLHIAEGAGCRALQTGQAVQPLSSRIQGEAGCPHFASAEPVRQADIVRRNLIEAEAAALIDGRTGGCGMLHGDYYSGTIRGKGHGCRYRESVITAGTIPRCQQRDIHDGSAQTVRKAGLTFSTEVGVFVYSRVLRPVDQICPRPPIYTLRGHCIKVTVLSGSCERTENLCGVL